QARLDALALIGFDLGLVDGSDGVAEAVQERTAGAHVVLDFVGAPALADNLRALRADGTMVLVGLMGGSKTDINFGAMLMRRQRLLSIVIPSLSLEPKIIIAQMFNDRMFPLFESGALRHIVDREFTFEDVVAALQ